MIAVDFKPLRFILQVDVLAFQGAISFKLRRTKFEAKHAPAALVQPVRQAFARAFSGDPLIDEADRAPLTVALLEHDRCALIA